MGGEGKYSERAAISETRVNQHIDMLKRRLGVNTHRELATRYRELSQNQVDPFSSSSGGISKLPGPKETTSSPTRAPDGGRSLADVHAFSLEAPWSGASEPRVVHPVLDGDHAVSVRVAVIAANGLRVAGFAGPDHHCCDSLSEVIGSRPDKQFTG